MPPTDRPGSGSTTTFFPLSAKPGIKRDGTRFDGGNFTDGRWSRFQRGRPRKQGGYRSISESFQGPIRTVLMHPDNDVTRLFVGSTTRLEYSDLSPDGIGAGIGDITPTGLVVSDQNIWTLDEMIDSIGGTSQLLAHAAPNLGSIASTADRKLWVGPIDGSAVLTDSSAPEVSGGVLAAPPYAIVYGNDGYYSNCVPNDPTDWSGAGSNEANVTRQKVVFGSQVRGGAGASPAFNLWSLDSVLRATFAGGSGVFDFDTVSRQSSVLSSRGFIEYDGIWFWAGIDRFLMYTGVVQELQNDMNINWFFDNLNWSQRQKVWATKIPRFQEIWWWFPYGDSEDCNAAIIFNLNPQNGPWYDTGVATGSTEIARVHGYYPQVFRWPVWADAAQSPSTLVRISGGTPDTSDQPAAVTIGSITWAAGVATVTTTTNHGLSSDWTVNLSGQTPSEYSGTYNITVTAADEFTYAEATDPGGAAGVVGTYTVGDAAFAFDGNLTTYCTQDAADGNIGVDYGSGVTKTVNRVGINSAATLTYDLAFQYSDENYDNWTTFYEPGSQEYTAGQDYYFTILTSVTARGFRVLEQGGETLNLAELYFDTYGYMVHQHEYGVDRVVGGQVLAIPSYIETCDISYMAEGPMGDRWLGVDRWVNLQSIEYDFIQSGEMTVSVLGSAYARGGGPADEVTETFGEDTWKVDFSPGVERRQLRLRFTSNQAGGDYQFGQIALWIEDGDGDRPNQDGQ